LFSRTVESNVSIGLIKVWGSRVPDSTVNSTLMVSTALRVAGLALKSIGRVKGVPVDPWLKAKKIGDCPVPFLKFCTYT